jgi:hypothetical protein
MTTPDPFTPTVEDVAALIRARTKDSNGNEVGTFNADTRPTATQAQEAIDHALAALHEKVGSIGNSCSDVARMAATYGAAAEIELSYFPEQARTDRSPYTYLLNRYEQLLVGVQECVLGNLPDYDDGGIAATSSAALLVTSGVVNDFYGGRFWPRITPEIPPPDGSDDPDNEQR